MPRFAQCLIVVTLCGATAASAADYGFGDGHDGVLMVSGATTVNAATGLTADLQAGSRFVQVSDTTGFVAGRLVMLHRAQVPDLPPDSGLQGDVDLADAGLGAWELARVISSGGNTVELDVGPTTSYSLVGTQLISVPEYSEVTISDAGVLSAPPWNGSSGGVVALLVNGAITSTGLISVEGAGFRGARPTATSTTGGPFTDLDAAPPKCALKGEGVYASFGLTVGGRGNLANGGGGGCAGTGSSNGGGGGGAHRGRGGRGGNPTFSGLGAARAYGDPRTALAFGGGGGAGAVHATVGKGSPGGGAIFIRSKALIGGGLVSASGLGGAQAGGGGAGGTVHLEIEGDVDVADIAVNGGRGGNTGASDFGPGGGGGGGLIVIWATSINGPTRGLAGLLGFYEPAHIDYLAEPASTTAPEHVGLVLLQPTGWTAPPAPVITAPTDGMLFPPGQVTVSGTTASGTVSLEVDGVAVTQGPAPGTTFALQTPALSVGPHRLTATVTVAGVRGAPSRAVLIHVIDMDAGAPDAGATDAGSVDAGPAQPPEAPAFRSTPNDYAVCGWTYHYSAHRTPEVAGARPLHFTLERVGGDLPPGLVLDATTGELTWQPMRADVGTVPLRLTVSNAAGSAAQEWELNIDCPPQGDPWVGCSCTSAPSLLGAVLLLGHRFARRRRPLPR